MKVLINQLPHDLPEGASLAVALVRIEARPPFATAVNQQFVPSTQHASTLLRDGDDIEIIQPVTGG
ncbi:thiamine biosynthesis protein ThiS [Rhodoferax koreense]|uniref:Thiamine biosynthesis protein ThiS n=1 Tax=Rhodoferax koreensis TaxID=1842727 RepID=A0A1P8JXM3_9BURK|nr:sulfur carrier protein ThiS [Rhodoferax koreense]APW38509.1 thiamine biosynthesis protein ThiS [Rhodoferax koreense]